MILKSIQTLGAVALVLALAACGGDDGEAAPVGNVNDGNNGADNGNNNNDADNGNDNDNANNNANNNNDNDNDTGAGFTGVFQSKSGTTALASDGSWFASTNRDDGSVTVYEFAGETSLGSASRFTVSLGDASSEVSSIVRGHDDSYLLATAQYDQQVCRIEIDGGAAQTPSCTNTGSEPTAVVTDEEGARVYVANMVDGTVRVYDEALALQETLDFSDANGETGVNPFALLYLRRESDDDDGNVFVTDFYAEKVPGGQEGSDTGRQGAVYVFPSDATSAGDATKIVLPPLEETGFRIPSEACNSDDDAGCANDTSGAFPNQLSSISYDSGRIFVTSTCASPRGNFRFNMNLHSCVHVIDASTNDEIPALRLNIQERIKQQEGEDKLFCTVPSDLACVPGTPFCYVTCASSDLVMRLDYKDFSAASSVEAGLSAAKNLPTGKFPTGISILADGQVLAFVNNENSYNVTTLNLNTQSQAAQTQSVPLPTAGSIEETVLRGKDFFFTARGRWSNARWSSCVGCHPRGLTDNVTWHFPTGPRQTVSMDASFSKETVTADRFGNKHGFSAVLAALSGADFPQRIFNWTSVRDEVADFELNIRGVSGGKGAIVDGEDNPIDISGANDTQDALIADGIGNNANNLGSTEALVAALDTNRDWDEVTEWVKTIRSPRAKTNTPGDADAGETLFTETYGCTTCHAGGSWTTSMRYYTPTLANEGGGAQSDDLRSTLVSDFTDGKNALLLSQVPVTDANSSCTSDADCADIAGACDLAEGVCISPALGFEFYASTPRGIDQHACVLRDVGTYEGQDQAEGALEVRRDMVTPAQGEAGFNTPSVLNTQLGAPYLHNGRYESLAEFLLDGDTAHVLTGSAVASIDQDQARDLVAFLLSVDGSTPAPVPNASDLICEEL